MCTAQHLVVVELGEAEGFGHCRLGLVEETELELHLGSLDEEERPRPRTVDDEAEPVPQPLEGGVGMPTGKFDPHGSVQHEHGGRGAHAELLVEVHRLAEALVGLVEAGLVAPPIGVEAPDERPAQGRQGAGTREQLVSRRRVEQVGR